MSSVKWEVGSVSSVMTTELDSLAVDTNAISANIDNSTDLFLFEDVELAISEGYGSDFIDGHHLDLYLVREQLDGGGYEDGNASIDPPAVNLVGVFVIGPTLTSQVHILRQITIPPSAYKYVLINQSDDLNTSGNTLKRRPYAYQTV